MKHPVDVIAAKRAEIQSLVAQAESIQKRVNELTGHIQTLESCLPLLQEDKTPAAAGTFGNIATAAAPAKETKRWP